MRYSFPLKVMMICTLPPLVCWMEAEKVSGWVGVFVTRTPLASRLILMFTSAWGFTSVRLNEMTRSPPTGSVMGRRMGFALPAWGGTTGTFAGHCAPPAARGWFGTLTIVLRMLLASQTSCGICGPSLSSNVVFNIAWVSHDFLLCPDPFAGLSAGPPWDYLRCKAA
jgi:hypothetical protein